MEQILKQPEMEERKDTAVVQGGGRLGEAGMGFCHPPRDSPLLDLRVCKTWSPNSLDTFLLFIIPNSFVPLIFFPGASLCMPFSLPELLAGHPLGVLPWTFRACPVSFVPLPHSAQHSVGQGYCMQLCGGMAWSGAPTERLSFSSSPLTKAYCFRSRRCLFALLPAGRCEGAIFSYLHKRTWRASGDPV